MIHTAETPIFLAILLPMSCNNLAINPLTTEELVNRISPTIESSNIPELTEAVSGVLEELLALDILKRE